MRDLAPAEFAEISATALAALIGLQISPRGRRTKCDALFSSRRVVLVLASAFGGWLIVADLPS
jgi:hypothetical protein